MPAKIKAESAPAKEDAKLKSHNRKVYKQYDEDVARFGRPVADYNAGFVAGDNHRRRKSKKR
jgi:hypothetical protein